MSTAGRALLGMAWQAWFGSAGQGTAWFGSARQAVQLLTRKGDPND